MGASSSVIKEKQNNLFDLKNLPEDQYVCSDCDSIPEIISLSFNKGIIEFRCKEHGIKKIDIKEYFRRESKYLYSNIKCYLDQNHIQKDQLYHIFRFKERESPQKKPAGSKRSGCIHEKGSPQDCKLCQERDLRQCAEENRALQKELGCEENQGKQSHAGDDRPQQRPLPDRTSA